MPCVPMQVNLAASVLRPCVCRKFSAFRLSRYFDLTGISTVETVPKIQSFFSQKAVHFPENVLNFETLTGTDGLNQYYFFSMVEQMWTYLHDRPESIGTETDQDTPQRYIHKHFFKKENFKKSYFSLRMKTNGKSNDKIIILLVRLLEKGSKSCSDKVNKIRNIKVALSLFKTKLKIE